MLLLLNFENCMSIKPKNTFDSSRKTCRKAALVRVVKDMVAKGNHELAMLFENYLFTCVSQVLFARHMFVHDAVCRTLINVDVSYV